jgi:hypothetical protein
MANEGGGYASSGESREDDDQMDMWKEFENRKTCKEIRNRLSIVSISDMVCQGRLTWSGRSDRTGANEACRNTTVSVERVQCRE